MPFDPDYIVKESDLLGTGAAERDDFDDAITDWVGVSTEDPPPERVTNSSENIIDAVTSEGREG